MVRGIFARTLDRWRWHGPRRCCPSHSHAGSIGRTGGTVQSSGHTQAHRGHSSTPGAQQDGMTVAIQSSLELYPSIAGYSWLSVLDRNGQSVLEFHCCPTLPHVGILEGYAYCPDFIRCGLCRSSTKLASEKPRCSEQRLTLRKSVNRL